MNHPKISILVPIYGTEKYIEKCCHSLFSQDYDNIEFIFVNDCTKDQSIEILYETLKVYPNRLAQVKIINHIQNRGLGASRLTGLENSTGDYVWFVDSDDYISYNAVSYISNIIVKGNHDLITFSYNEVKNNEITQKKIDPFSVHDLLTDRVNPSIWKNVIKRSLFYEYNIFPIEGIDYAEDLHLLYRLIIVARYRITLNEHFLYNYNVSNNTSMTHNVNVKSLNNLLDALMIVFDFYKSRNKLFDVRPFLASLYAISLIEIKDYGVFNQKHYDAVKSLDKIVYLILSSHLSNERKYRLIFRYRRIKYLFIKNKRILK